MSNKVAPFHIREAKGEAEYFAPTEGVPDWLFPSLFHWVKGGLVYPTTHNPNAPLFRQLDRVLRTTFFLAERESGPTFQRLGEKLKGNPELFFSVVEEVLNYNVNVAFLPELEEILEQAGSAFEVFDSGFPRNDGEGRNRLILVRRVDPTVKQAFEVALSKAGKAGLYLQQAWACVYRRESDPSSGYSLAVKAAEAATIPMVIPKDPLPTLGKVINALNGNGGDKFLVQLKPATGDAIGKVRALCELIWSAQHERHGSADPDKPIHYTQAEAEMALHAALTLVHWFSSGAVTMKPQGAP